MKTARPSTVTLGISPMGETFWSIINQYQGDVRLLERAIGVLVVGRLFGWKVLYLVHDKKTLKQYENILGVKFQKELPAEGSCAFHSLAYSRMKLRGNFWKAVRGGYKGLSTPVVVIPMVEKP